MEEDDDEEEKFRPKFQTESAGGGGSEGKTRIGASTPGDNSKGPPRHIQVRSENTGGGGPSDNNQTSISTPGDDSKRVCITENLTVKNLAQKLKLSDTAVIKHLFMLGVPRTVSQIVEVEWASKVAIDMGYDVVTSPDQMDER